MNLQSKIQNPKSKILVVEDSAIQAEMLRRILAKRGYDAFIAKDGAEGLSQTLDQKPELVISDINMPVMDGYEMCQKIKQDEATRHIPVILLTELSDVRDVFRGLEAGADHYITKPFQEEHLLSKVDDILTLPPNDRVKETHSGWEITIEDKTCIIPADKRKILNLLISTYENAVTQNRELIKTQLELKKFNEQLEERVKERTAALRDSEERYKTTLHTSQEGFWIANTGGRFVDVNDSCCNTLGYSRDELLAKTVQDIEASETPEQITQHMQYIIKTGSDRFETRYRRKDGRIIDVEVSVTYTHIMGDYFFVFFRNITGRKQMEEKLKEYSKHLEEQIKNRTAELCNSEERFRVAAQTTSDLIWEWDIINVRMEWFGDIDNLLGYARDEFPRTLESWEMAILPDDHTQMADALEAHLKEGKPYDIEYRVQRKDGTLLHISDRGIALKNEKGVPFKMIGACTDITRRKNNEEKIKLLNADLKKRSLELEAINKELEAFSYSVSHDLRAPLRSIDGFSKALLEDYADTLDEQGKDFLRRVRSATQRMAQLIDDILSLSRITRSEMRREDVNVSTMVHEIAEELKKTQPERPAEFIIAPDIIINCDARLIRIVFENLLGNAWKYTGKKPLTRIEFGTNPFEGHPAYFIRDNGAGFDMANVGKLFGAFQRLHSPSDFPGTGIGLATVQRIIHRHGGRIWAEGKVDEGATFYFTL